MIESSLLVIAFAAQALAADQAAPIAAPSGGVLEVPVTAAKPEPTPPASFEDFNRMDLRQATPEMLAKIRDPFKRPDLKVDLRPKSDLERFPVEQFQLLGVVTGPYRMRAMIRTPENKTLFVSENMRMGTRNGVISRITASMIVVKEKIQNIYGREEAVDIELKINTKPKSQDGSQGGSG